MIARKPLELHCARCDNCRWVCEFHPDRPWEGPRARGRGGAGAPCPLCNRVDDGTEPEMPDDFVVAKRVSDGN
jgi:hypothetical protein